MNKLTPAYQDICDDIVKHANKLKKHLESRDIKHESTRRLVYKLDYLLGLLTPNEPEEEYDITNDPRD